MLQDAKRSIGIVAGTLAALSLTILGGALLMGARDVHQPTYREAMAEASPASNFFATDAGNGLRGIDLTKMLTGTPKAVAQGKQLFGTYCTACHGTNGEGDGPAAVALHPSPRNFTSPKGWTRGYTLADIYITLTDGVPGTAMAAFSGISPKDRFALAHYVQSLGQFDHHDHPAAEIKKLDAKYHLSSGTKAAS